MDPDLERVLSEDESARASVERAASAARARLERERATIAREREDRRRILERELDAAVATRLADADREAAGRAVQRADRIRACSARADTLLDKAIETYVSILRDGPPAKLPP